jgi:hypothetical protein
MNTKKRQFEPAEVGKLIEMHFSSGLRGAGEHTLPFQKGIVCRLKNGKISPRATSEAGARWPRRGGVFPQRHVSNFQMNGL